MLGCLPSTKDAAKCFSNLISCKPHNNLLSLGSFFPVFEEISSSGVNIQDRFNDSTCLQYAWSSIFPPCPSFPRKQGFKELKPLATNHEASERKRWYLNQDCLPPKLCHASWNLSVDRIGNRNDRRMCQLSLRGPRSALPHIPCLSLTPREGLDRWLGI